MKIAIYIGFGWLTFLAVLGAIRWRNNRTPAGDPDGPAYATFTPDQAAAAVDHGTDGLRFAVNRPHAAMPGDYRTAVTAWRNATRCAEQAEARLAAAAFVDEHWRNYLLLSDNPAAAHPLAMVRAATDGTRDPKACGLPEKLHDAYRAIFDGTEQPEPQRYPAQIGVFCDICHTEEVHDYLVSDDIDQVARFEVARAHLRTQGWFCIAEGDFCPPCAEALRRFAEPNAHPLHLALERADHAEKEVERLRAGEEPVTDPAAEHTPGQWIWQWNEATAEVRFEVAARAMANSARADECILMGHKARIERRQANLDQHVAMLQALIDASGAMAEYWAEANEERRKELWRDLHLAADRAADSVGATATRPWWEHVDAARKEAREHEEQVLRVTEERDGAYRERAALLAWLAALHSEGQAVLTHASPDDTGNEGWPILFIYGRGRQLSWHINPRDLDLLGDVPWAETDDLRVQWDHHTTEEKYQRIQRLVDELWSTCGPECSEAHTYTGRCGDARTSVDEAKFERVWLNRRVQVQVSDAQQVDEAKAARRRYAAEHPDQLADGHAVDDDEPEADRA